MRIQTLSLAAATLTLCAWMPVQAQDANAAPRRCAGIAGSSACASGVVSLKAVLPVEAAKPKVKSEPKGAVVNTKPGVGADPEREIWRHHGVG